MKLSLAASEPDPQSGPEELFISALLESGRYTPNVYGVSDHVFIAHRNVHEFCKRVQELEGHAPPPNLVSEKFPSFKFRPSVPINYASVLIRDTAQARDMLKDFGRMGEAFREEDIGLVAEIGGRMHRRYTKSTTRGIDPLAFDMLDEYASTRMCPLPSDYLSSLTGGHPAGEVWLVVAKWGMGKSWRLIEHAVAALEGGWDVVFFSLEMSPVEIIRRFHKIALRDLPWPAMTIDEQRAAVTEWYSGCGSLSVYGPDQGAVDTAVITGTITNEHTLVCVDYVGRMYSSKGAPANEDWKTMGDIATELARMAADTKVPVLAAAQLNRQGTVAGSMELERAPHLIIEVDRVDENCDSVRVNTIKKSRGTVSHGKWFTLFDANRGRFHDISQVEALDIQIKEEKASVN